MGRGEKIPTIAFYCSSEPGFTSKALFSPCHYRNCKDKIISYPGDLCPQPGVPGAEGNVAGTLHAFLSTNEFRDQVRLLSLNALGTKVYGTSISLLKNASNSSTLVLNKQNASPMNTFSTGLRV